MDSRDARIALREARRWAARGLLPPQSLEVLEKEYAGAIDKDDDAPSIGLSILYGLAGILLGAACVAVIVLFEVDDNAAPWILAGLGVPLLAAGLLLWQTRKFDGITDALLVGSLVPLSAMALPDELAGKILAPFGLAAAVLVTWLPRKSHTVPLMGTIATFACSGILSYQYFRDTGFFFDELSEPGVYLWFSLALAQLAAVLVAGRALERPWRTLASSLLCVGLVLPFVLMTNDLFPNHDTRFYELLVGAFELVILLIGLGVRERGLVLGAALVIAGDAIVFAFDISKYFGLVVLIGLAVALVALAGTLKKLLRAT